MYDPKIARFLQEDTFRGDPNDPLSLNLYTYCHNEPIMYWDPSGHNRNPVWDPYRANDTDIDEMKRLRDKDKNKNSGGNKNNTNSNNSGNTSTDKSKDPNNKKSTTFVELPKANAKEARENRDVENYYNLHVAKINWDDPLSVLAYRDWLDKTYGKYRNAGDEYLESAAAIYIATHDRDKVIAGYVIYVDKYVYGITDPKIIEQDIKIALNFPENSTSNIEGIMLVHSIRSNLRNMYKDTSKEDGAKKSNNNTVDNVGGACFVAGTLIITKEGFRAIEDIEVGDEVYSQSSETGQKGFKKVLTTFTNITNILVCIYVDNVSSMNKW